MHTTVPFPSLPANSSVSVTTSSPLVVLTLTKTNKAKSPSKPATEMTKIHSIYIMTCFIYILDSSFSSSSTF